jgi:hypothetical protein
MSIASDDSKVNAGRIDVKASVGLRDLNETDGAISDKNTEGNWGETGVVNEDRQVGVETVGSQARVLRSANQQEPEASGGTVCGTAENEGRVDQRCGGVNVHVRHASRTHAGDGKVLVKIISGQRRRTKSVNAYPNSE